MAPKEIIRIKKRIIVNGNIEIQTFLEKIISCSKLHGLWLNTLSFLEYMGARKMAKALPQESLDKTLLDHLSEEARHSLYFKKLANRVSKKSLCFQSEELLSGREARAYFQNLDEKAKTLSGGNSFLNYLFTTWLIEQRAVLVYTIYNQLLLQKKFSFSLSSLLKEEIGHLIYVKNSIKRFIPIRLENSGSYEREKPKQDQFNYEKALSILKDFEEKEFQILIECMNLKMEEEQTDLQI